MTDAVLVGATGLIGGFCLAGLLASPRYDQVRVISRKPLAQSHEKLEVAISDFETLMSSEALPVTGADLFICLGTTHKQAGSKAAFRRVDHDYVLRVAELALAAGTQQLMVVSALGANAKARSHYSRVKGEVEAKLAAMNPPSLHLFRPSLLLGPRQEFRFGEKMGEPLAKLFAPLMVGGARAYRPVQAQTVAERMINEAAQDKRGQHVHYFHQ